MGCLECMKGSAKAQAMGTLWDISWGKELETPEHRSEMLTGPKKEKKKEDSSVHCWDSVSAFPQHRMESKSVIMMEHLRGAQLDRELVRRAHKLDFEKAAPKAAWSGQP